MKSRINIIKQCFTFILLDFAFLKNLNKHFFILLIFVKNDKHNIQLTKENNENRKYLSIF